MDKQLSDSEQQENQEPSSADDDSQVSLSAQHEVSHPKAHGGLILLPVNESSPSLLSGKSIVLHKHFSEALESDPLLKQNPSKSVDMDAPNKPISIYHLLLDTQLELSSDGDKIVCSKATTLPLPPSKRKRKNEPTPGGPAPTVPSVSPSSSMSPSPSSSSLTAAVPALASSTDKVRSALISMQETAMNSGETERITKFFMDHCHADCVVQLDLSKLGARHGLFIYREIRGKHGIAAYFSTTMQAIPDAVTLYWQLKNEKLPDGQRELQAKTLTVGKQLYEVDVIDDEESHSEQENIELVVAGLTSLASACSSADAAAVPDTSASLGASPSQPVDSRFGGTGDAAAAAISQTAPRKRKLRSLNDMNILVAQGSVDFQCGKPLQREINVSYTGLTTWTLNAEKKITKLHFVLM